MVFNECWFVLRNGKGQAGTLASLPSQRMCYLDVRAFNTSKTRLHLHLQQLPTHNSLMHPPTRSDSHVLSLKSALIFNNTEHDFSLHCSYNRNTSIIIVSIRTQARRKYPCAQCFGCHYKHKHHVDRAHPATIRTPSRISCGVIATHTARGCTPVREIPHAQGGTRAQMQEHSLDRSVLRSRRSRR